VKSSAAGAARKNFDIFIYPIHSRNMGTVPFP